MRESLSSPRPEGTLLDLARQLGFRPLVLMAGGLALGIAAADRLDLPFSLPLVVGCLAAVLLCWVLGHLSGAARLGIGAVFVPLGVLLHSLPTLLPAHHLVHYLPLRDARLVGVLEETPGETPDGCRLILNCAWVAQGSQWQRTTGRVSLLHPGSPPRLLLGDGVCVGVRYLAAPSPPTNPGQFDARRYYRQRGLCARGTVQDLQRLPGSPTIQGRVEEFLVAERSRALEALQQAMPGKDAPFYAGLLGGMVYGQRAAGPLDHAKQELFRRTGTIHLLVVSGAQITFIIAVLIALVSGRGRWALQPWHLLLIFPPMLAFSLFAGIAGSVTRGLLMAGVLAYALVSHRRYDPYSALALAAFAMMLANTQIVFDVGAQLTFAACLGVVAFVPPPKPDLWTGRPVRPPFWRTVVWAGVGAWALTAPIIVANFHGLPLLGNLANLLAVPLSLLVMPLGMLALLTGTWLLPVTTAICWVCRLLMDLMLLGNRVCAALPGAYLDLVEFGPLLTIGWYVLVGGGLLLVARADLRRRWGLTSTLLTRDRLSAAGGLVLAAIILALAWSLSSPPRLTLTVLDVGEGNCFLLQAPGGRAMMVDAGRSGEGTALAEDLIIPFLAHRQVRRLDYFVLTHGDTDHCNALPTLLRRVAVGEYWDPLLGGASTYEEVLAEVRNQRLPVQEARADQELRLGGGVTVRVVAPRDPLLIGTGAEGNDNSLALLISYGQTRLLLTGDQEAAGLERLVAGLRLLGASGRAQVVVLPHHGRSAPWCRELLRESGAQWGLVSGTRGPWARRELGDMVRVVSTGELGALEVISDGRAVRVRRAR